MDFFEAVNARCSMRKYATMPVEESKLQQILEAVNRAPSAGNLQGYEVYVVRDLEKRQMLCKAAWDQGFLLESPLILVFCSHPSRSAEKYGERGETLYAVQDATIACTFAMLAATALGLSSVWVGAFEPEQVWQVIGGPEGELPVAMLPIGYPAKELRVRPRRPLQEIVHEVK